MTTTRPAVQPGPRTVAAPPRPSRVGGFAAAALLVLLGVLGLTLFASMGGPLRDDVAWLLYIADRWLDGQRPYVGLLETNPPTIIWISTLPAALARALGLPTLLVAPPVFAGLVLGCAWWAADILRRRGVLEYRLITFAVLGVVLLGLPAGTSGSASTSWSRRRSLTCVAGGKLRRGPTRADRLGRRSARRRARRHLLRHEAFLRVGLRLGRGRRGPPRRAAAVRSGPGRGGHRCRPGRRRLPAPPEYFSEAVPLVLAFYWVGDPGFVDVIRASAVLLSCLAAAWLLWLVRGRTGVADRGGVAWVLLVFAAGATLAYLLQGKGWFYQRVPAVVATALALLAMAAAAVQAAARPLPERPRGPGPEGWVATVAAAALLALGFLSAVQFAQRIKVAIAPERTLEARLAGLIRAEGARSYVAFSRTLGLGFPVVNETGVVWASRFVSTWALYGEHLRAERAGPGTAAATAPVAGRWMVEDFLAVCPELVVVDDRDGLDYPRLLGAADPRFVPVGRPTRWSRPSTACARSAARAHSAPPRGARRGLERRPLNSPRRWAAAAGAPGRPKGRRDRFRSGTSSIERGSRSGVPLRSWRQAESAA
jgi:hypothetical protein